MKIPATVRIADGKAWLEVRTRVFSGDIAVGGVDITKEKFGTIPGLGACEDGQEVAIELTRDISPRKSKPDPTA